MIPIGVEEKSEKLPIPDDLIDTFRDRIVLGHVASFVPEKNHMGMLRIIDELVPRYDKLICLMVGDGRLRPVIEEEIAKRRLDRHVLLTGYRADVLNIMSHARAILLPSLIEGLPGVILEAMQCGTPVVAYDVGGIGEVLQSGKTGWLVPVGDEQAFARAIEEVFNGDSREGIVEMARRSVSERFNNRQIAKEFLQVYNKVAFQAS